MSHVIGVDRLRIGQYNILVRFVPICNSFHSVIHREGVMVKTVTKYIDLSTAKKVADLCPAGYREMLLMAVATGYRISDICDMMNWQYDRTTKEVIAEEDKTGKIRVVTLPEWLVSIMQEYDRRHPERKYLVSQPGGGKISRQTAWRWIRRGYRELCGNDADGIGPHSLRKCYAVERRKAGVSLADVQRDLNHDSRTTTMVYYFADVCEPS